MKDRFQLLTDFFLQAEKIQIHFAKRAKRIDVRRLKSAMWTLIKDEEETSESEEKDSEEELLVHLCWL